MSETLVSLWQRSRDALIAAGVDSPVLDARLLLEVGAGVSRTDIVTDPRRELTADQVAGVETLVARRVKREPVSHIIGRKAFWTLDLAVSPAVLTPRPETEFVVDVAIKHLPTTEPARVLDLGVGSGAILFSVLAERDLVSGIGLDLSPEAIAVARGNAEALKLDNRIELHVGGWDVTFDERFDLVLSNPPYIPTAEIDTLAPEVSVHEPRMALDGGPDGLDAYRAIMARLPALLKPEAMFVFEVGKGQAPAVAALAAAQGLMVDPAKMDLAGIARVVSGRLPG